MWVVPAEAGEVLRRAATRSARGPTRSDHGDDVTVLKKRSRNLVRDARLIAAQLRRDEREARGAARHRRRHVAARDLAHTTRLRTRDGRRGPRLARRREVRAPMAVARPGVGEGALDARRARCGQRAASRGGAVEPAVRASPAGSSSRSSSDEVELDLVALAEGLDVLVGVAAQLLGVTTVGLDTSRPPTRAPCSGASIASLSSFWIASGSRGIRP